MSRQNIKFEEASAKIKESLNKFEFEDSSEEENDFESADILNKVFDKYKGKSNNFEKTYQFLTDSLKSGSSTCVICIGSIKRNHEIWSCKYCFTLLHLSCIKIWSKDCMSAKSPSSKNTLDIPKWSCPNCRFEFLPNEKPDKYFCFCKKVENPKTDPWNLPHSCGETCQKKLEPLCGHSCLILCHPGKCPPCPQNVKSSCHCGKQKPTPRRCGDKYWSCNQTCNKILSCQQHYCLEPCHAGDCKPCPKQSIQKCICTQNKMLRPCNSPDWKCQVVCNERLACGNHKCQEVCHDGVCKPCPRSGLRKCPCGKSTFELECTKEVSLCGDTCNKKLECEVHNCIERCHFGACNSCLQMSQKSCRCGRFEKHHPCSKPLLCKNKCKNIKDCQRHACGRKCCEGDCPPCEQVCNKLLACTKHKCTSICHSGPCFPCNIKERIECECKKTFKIVPCGKTKVVLSCNLPCNKPPVCHHPTQVLHKCHHNSCPFCKQICNKMYPECKHSCSELCHTAKMITINPSSEPKSFPWEKRPAPIKKIVNEPCPPCKVMLPLICKGRHEINSFECSKLKEWSCGRKCDRRLDCTKHSCQLECHKVSNPKSEIGAGDNCVPCEEGCLEKRPKGCSHICLLPCHPGTCPLCTQKLKQKCHCQLSILYIPCSEWTSADDEGKVKLMTCLNQCPKLLTCSHRCPNSCHPGKCPEQDICKKKITLRCQCRNRKQEIMCNKALPLECNENCKEIKEEKRALEELQRAKQIEKELEEERKEKELLQQKHKARKNRKRRGSGNIVQKPSKIKQYQNYIFLSSIVILFAILYNFLI